MLCKHMFGGDTFEDPYDLTDAVLRVKAHQYMDVVPVITKLFNRQVIPLFKASHSLTHSGDNFSAQKCLTILHGEDEVVVGVVRAVVTLGDGHPTSIAAFERNLRFPSNSPPLKEPRGRDHGENADYNIRNQRQVLRRFEYGELMSDNYPSSSEANLHRNYIGDLARHDAVAHVFDMLETARCLAPDRPVTHTYMTITEQDDPIRLAVNDAIPLSALIEKSLSIEDEARAKLIAGVNIRTLKFYSEPLVQVALGIQTLEGIERYVNQRRERFDIVQAERKAERDRLSTWRELGTLTLKRIVDPSFRRKYNMNKKVFGKVHAQREYREKHDVENGGREKLQQHLVELLTDHPSKNVLQEDFLYLNTSSGRHPNDSKEEPRKQFKLSGIIGRFLWGGTK